MIKANLFLGCALCAIIGCTSAQRPENQTTTEPEQNLQRENPYLKMIDQSLYTPFVSDQSGPLADTITIKIAQWGILDGYEIVGYAEIQGETIQDRIRLAEKYSRAYGADVIMPKGITTREQLKSTYRDRSAQGFLLWRKKPSPASVPPITVIDTRPAVKGGASVAPVPLPVPKIEDSLLQDSPSVKSAAEPDDKYPVYGKLPRLTYNKLIENSDDIRTQNYRGASYALKLFKIPEDIGLQVNAEDRMAMLATKSGENKLFMLVPSDKMSWLQEMIKSDKVMEYVYKPVGVYKEKYPVIQFVDEMK